MICIVHMLCVVISNTYKNNRSIIVYEQRTVLLVGGNGHRSFGAAPTGSAAPVHVPIVFLALMSSC